MMICLSVDGILLEYVNSFQFQSSNNPEPKYNNIGDDQYRFLWTAIRGFFSEFGLFSWRALSGQLTRCQALTQ